jgi:hypothetical protein
MAANNRPVRPCSALAALVQRPLIRAISDAGGAPAGISANVRPLSHARIYDQPPLHPPLRLWGSLAAFCRAVATGVCGDRDRVHAES